MEIEVLKKIIKNNSDEYYRISLNSIISERYYKNDNDILHKKLENEEEVPLRNADNRIASSFYSLLVNQKASYLFTAPPLFDVGNKQSNKTITEILGDGFSKKCKDLCINAANSGVAWLHYWLDENQIFNYAVVDTKQILPIWSSDLNRKLMAVLRIYKNVDDNGDVFTVYEYWTDVECTSFVKKTIDGNVEVFEPFNMFTLTNLDEGVTEPTNVFKHTFGRVPFIPFFNNNIVTGDLKNIKGLIDTYDKVYSGFVNDLEDIQEIIFILTGYEGTDLKSFLSDIKKYKTVKLDAEESAGLNTLTIDIPIEAREKLLTLTRKAIFEQGQGVDPDPQSFGNSSGVALKYLYSLLELKAGLLETEFKLSFGELLRVIGKIKGIQINNIIQTWTRTAITNDLELADICQKSVGIVSNKSILKAHPLVENLEAEEKELEKKEQEYKDDFKEGMAGEE